jgi:hypothetical protein
MKKTILIIFAAITTVFSAQGQTKPAALKAKVDTTKVKPAPIYQPDLTSKHDVVLKGISIQQLNDWVIYSTNKPEDITNSDKISSKTATRIINNYLLIGSQLKNQIDTLLAKDKLKWQADTAKKGKTK